MLPVLLIYLSVVPLSFAFASSLARSNVLSSVSEHAIQDAPSYGQLPIIRPHHPPHNPEKVDGTIYEFLANDPRFTLVTKALKFEEDILTFLNDSSANLTFFAPPDDVLRHPKHDNNLRKLEWATVDALSDGDLLSLLEFADFGRVLDLLDDDEGHLPNDPKKRKKILKFILHALLSYHIIPKDYDIVGLGLNNTFPTKLVFPHVFDGQPIRLKIQQTLIPYVTTINLYARVIQSTSATNGFVHAVNHPLLPPPSTFQELYFAIDYFSIFTSAIQRSGLTDLLDLRYTHKNGFEGAPLVTVFAPTNYAFQRLPKRLKFFLFSPFGERVLKKLLQYHIVPDLAFFSDYVHHGKVQDGFDCMDVGMEEISEEPIRPWYSRFRFPRPARNGPIVEPISHREYKLETALLEHSLDVVVDQKKITLPLPGHKLSVIDTKVFVNHNLVPVRDIVGLNGGIHVITKLLDPRKHCHHDDNYEGDEGDDWEDWEEWLPQWGEA